MAVTSRNNGFRKVAKWIVGAVVVASASSGIVMAEKETPKIPEVTEVPEEEQTKMEVTEVPEKKDSNAAKGKQKKKQEPVRVGEVQLQRIKDEMEREEPVYDPDEVAVVTSTGKTYKNQDIDDLIDKNVYISALTRWFHPKSVPHIEKCELNRRRKEMRIAIREFDEFLKQLPEELAKDAREYEYPTMEHLPSEMADQIHEYLKKKQYDDMVKRLPEDLALEIAEYTSLSEIPEETKEKIDWFLANNRFHGLLDRIPEELAKEVAKYHDSEIPNNLRKEIERHMKKEQFHKSLEGLPSELVDELMKYSSPEEVPAELMKKVVKIQSDKQYREYLETLPSDLADEAKKYQSFADIPEDLFEKIKSCPKVREAGY